MVETNLVGTHRVTKAVLDPMCEQGFGRIVTISSFVGQLGNYGQSNYAATKGGLIAWTKTLAYEVARYGVTVNCVCPGFIDTDMLRGVPEHVREQLLARVPLGRFGEPGRDRARRALPRARRRVHHRHLPEHQRRAVHVIAGWWTVEIACML